MKLSFLTTEIALKDALRAQLAVQIAEFLARRAV
jgi:hypothetical protein